MTYLSIVLILTNVVLVVVVANLVLIAANLVRPSASGKEEGEDQQMILEDGGYILIGPDAGEMARKLRAFIDKEERDG